MCPAPTIRYHNNHSQFGKQFRSNNTLISAKPLYIEKEAVRVYRQLITNKTLRITYLHVLSGTTGKRERERNTL